MKAVQKITSIILVVVLLLSGLGFTLNKMVCLKSGKTKISFLHIKDCCSEKKFSQASIKANCCDLKNSFFNLDDFSFSEKVNAPLVGNTGLILWQNNPVEVCHSVGTCKLFAADLPPPLHGRQLLSFISILII